MSKRILITGGAGFIGYHLSKRLLETEDVEITIADNLWRSGMDTFLSELLKDPRVTLIECDVSKESEYAKLQGPYDHIYHLAAVNGTDNFYKIPHEVLRVNVQSLFYILDWMRVHSPKGKIMFTSSNEAYASNLEAFDQLPFPTPENVPLSIADTYNARWSYGGSKLIGELMVIHYAKAYNLRAVIVRPHNFFGPRGGYGHVIPQFIERIVARVDPFPIYGSTDTRSFGYIDDVVASMADVMEHKDTDGPEVETIHLGGGEEIAIKDLAEILFDIAGWKPASLDIHSSPPGSVTRRLPDISKIRAMIGYDTLTPLREGLTKTFEWYKNNPRTEKDK